MGISGPKSRPNSVEGGFVEGGVGIGTKTSPALEKIRAEIRHVCAGQAENIRILEYLEKGGDPLAFRHVNIVSPTVQSTSLKCMEKKRKRVAANDDEK
ncbi:hypothetical protein KY290_010321 [Solanum tuberosum]|uniref:Uncharacterized protein n=1 Tax=Solanum tuberosum TaxID=4113 RepID=A0ABQ7VXI9_SOLTU|nr:hypothetical protein KY290_010321 [Solanum tuberosum]